MSMECFDRLSPFMRRARIYEIGRERLYQVKNRLQFLLVTEDISANSLGQLLRDFSCPVYKAMTMSDIERYFGFHGTKVLGFRRHPLSGQAQAALKEFLVKPQQAREGKRQNGAVSQQSENNGVGDSAEHAAAALTE